MAGPEFVRSGEWWQRPALVVWRRRHRGREEFATRVLLIEMGFQKRNQGAAQDGPS
jgi:hypothetical protein